MYFMQINHLNANAKYLSIALFLTRLKVKDFQYLVDNMPKLDYQGEERMHYLGLVISLDHNLHVLFYFIFCDYDHKTLKFGIYKHNCKLAHKSSIVVLSTTINNLKVQCPYIL